MPLSPLSMSTLALIEQRDEIEGRYKFLVKNFENARQSEQIKTLGQKHKARIDDAKSQLDEAYKKLIARLDDLIEVNAGMEGSADPSASTRAVV